VDGAGTVSDATMTTVLLADDQAIVRAGVRTLLEPASDIDIVGEAADGLEALTQVAALRPDVTLMDIRMPNLNGIDATRRIVSAGHDTKVVILTTYGLDEYVYNALLAGAAGFLLKTEAPERFIDAVRAAAAGDRLLGPATTRQLIERYLSTGAPTREPPRELQSLTEREREVLRLVAAGLSNQELAVRLHIGEGTVKTHVARMLAKLGCRDRVQAVVYAYEHGFVRPGTN
jgi:DNA-binding NarL/FixJ family response regulator